MVIIGVLLLVAAVVVLIDMALASDGVVNVHLFGWHPGGLGPGRFLLLGAIIGVVGTLGVISILAGQARARRRRKESKRNLQGTREENKRLAAELDEQRARAAAEASSPAGQVTTGDDAAYPSERRADSDRAGADYVLGAKYPHDTTGTPPAPPTNP
jgi:hypothetical protein